MANFCGNCGNKVNSNEKFCPSCGAAIAQQDNTENVGTPNNNQYYQNSYASVNTMNNKVQDMVSRLSEKNKINGIIWLIIGIIQILIFLASGFIAIWTLIVGILNIIGGCRDISYSKELLAKPVAIISRYKSVVPIVIAIIYNLIFGGVIGIAGNIYEITIRNFVLNNKDVFELAEKRMI